MKVSADLSQLSLTLRCWFIFRLLKIYSSSFGHVRQHLNAPATPIKKGFTTYLPR